MNEEYKRQWVAALRSEDYEQATGMLRADDYKGKKHCCCLGVICDLLEPDKWELSKGWEEFPGGPNYRDPWSWAIYGTGSLLPHEIIIKAELDDDLHYLGLSGASPEIPVLLVQNRFPEKFKNIPAADMRGDSVPLTALNDNGFTFAEIADLIEAGL